MMCLKLCLMTRLSCLLVEFFFSFSLCEKLKDSKTNDEDDARWEFMTVITKKRGPISKITDCFGVTRTLAGFLFIENHTTATSLDH